MATATNMPAVSHPHRFPSDGNYVVARDNLLFDGKRYRRGEPLADDCSIRARPRSLETQVRFRNLVLAPPNYQQPEAQAPKTTAPAPAPKQEKVEVPPDIKTLTLHELQDQLKARGLKHGGNKGQLRARLAAALAE